jgi:hypothetical protein
MRACLLFLIVATTALGVTVNTDATCHPQCKWLCDDPVCPAKCHPVCARPKCQMNCEPTGCAACEVRCEEPVCSVRCPKEMCESKNCPSCETVCRPAVCRTTCTAPEPNCTPLCEKTKCAWKCKTPTLCPKPKCQLACEKPKCDSASTFGSASLLQESQQCCPCANQGPAMLAIQEADKHSKSNGISPNSPRMSLIEVMHTSAFKQQESTEESSNECCPCAKVQS